MGQQISTKAQKTIWGRMEERFFPITPQNIASIEVEVLQSVGISMRKAGYIKAIAQSVVVGELNLDELYTMEDSGVCKRLVQIKGIGVWTAEMLMIFSMGRTNILSFDDLAIQRGIKRLYSHEKMTKQMFEMYRERYSPYGSVASLYLWEIAGGRKLSFLD